MNASKWTLDGRSGQVWKVATQVSPRRERPSGSAKGLWHHGTRIATGSKGTYKTTGWVKASAFCS